MKSTRADGAAIARRVIMRAALSLLVASTVVWAQRRELPTTVPLSDGHTVQVQVTKAVPWFGLVSSPDGHVLVVNRGLVDPTYVNAAPDAGVGVVRLRKPANVTLQVTAIDGGVEVKGADVERYALSFQAPPERRRSFFFAARRPDVVQLDELYHAGSCPSSGYTTYFALKNGRALPLLTATATGDGDSSHGVLVHWGGSQGDALDAPGFAKLELVPGVPGDQQVTAVDMRVDEGQLTCATRRRYRYVDGALQLLDTTHADTGCPRAE